MPRCLVCRGLDESVPAVHGIPLRLIIKSFDDGRGCQTCGILVRAYFNLKENTTDEENVMLSWDNKRLDGLRVVVMQGAKELLFSIDIFCRGEDKPPWELGKHGESAREISGDTASNAAILKISEWIQTCQSTHSCAKSSSISHLPTRVLDVSKPDTVRLHCILEGDVISYACLSHCWGSTQSLVTTTSNFLRNQEHIPWEILPNSFQDAVSITRRLRIPYLWIDSLCIIQDSQEDWQMQSANMASIYAGSTVTIAAAMSSSDHYSFTSISPPAYLSQSLIYHSESGMPQTVHMRRTLTHGTGPTPFPLLTRGWVLQERLLSPRVVHFTSDELIWECMENTTCECGCIRFLWSPGWVPFHKDLLYESTLAMASRADLRASWHSIVQEYSRLNLSFNSDRLPAISGAARRLSPFQGCNYYAGLWKNSFVRDLMWKRRGSLVGSKRVDAIPSWSWASISAEVTFDEEAISTTEMVAVIDIATESAPGSDQFGQVSGGIAVISGFLASLHQISNTLESADRDANLRKTLHQLGIVTLDHDGGSIAETKTFFLKLSFQSQAMNSEENKEVSLILLCINVERNLYQRVGLLERMFEGSHPEFDVYEDITEPTEVSII